MELLKRKCKYYKNIQKALKVYNKLFFEVRQHEKHENELMLYAINYIIIRSKQRSRLS